MSMARDYHPDDMNDAASDSRIMNANRALLRECRAAPKRIWNPWEKKFLASMDLRLNEREEKITESMESKLSDLVKKARANPK
jgi:hypothetical protein